MKQYVVGFSFDVTATLMVVILKKKPDWQKGKFNGIGGIMEETDKGPFEAMTREYEEETGVFISNEQWDLFARLKGQLKGEPYELFCFRVWSDEILKAKTMESEQVFIIPVSAASSMTTTQSCRTLIPMALDKEFLFSTIEHSN